MIKKVTFDLNLLICGNYVESKISEKLKNKEVKKLETYEGKPYKKKGSSKNVEGWNYYLFIVTWLVHDTNTFDIFTKCLR